jgi:hypothetical protein
MPQCGRLRSMGVRGFEPTDPPPQKIEEEMKGAPYRRRPEGRFLRLPGRPRDSSRLSAGLFAAKLWACGRTNRVSKNKDQVAALEFDSGTIQATELKPGDIPSFPWRTEPSCQPGKLGASK